MNLKIVADENMEGVAESLGELGSVHLVPGRDVRPSDLQDADVLLVRSVTTVNEALLASTPVRFVGTATSGFDHVDRTYLHQNSIGFSHAPGSNANSVVEYVLAGIAAVDDKLEQLFAGGTVGIIGYGNIGSLLVDRLSRLGIPHRVYDPWLDEKQLSNPASLAEVLQSDVVSLHAELTGNEPWPSFHLLGKAELLSLGDSSLLINASRGGIVDNIALENHLAENQGFTAILDVWEGEPIVRQSLLSRVKFGTAHIAGYSLDGKLRATSMLKDAVIRHFNDNGAANINDSIFTGVPSLQLPGGLSGATLLRALLQYNYDISLDDQLLRAAVVDQTDLAAAASFDRLRRDYRCRRELFGAEIEVAVTTPADLGILEAMGCKLINSHGTPA